MMNDENDSEFEHDVENETEMVNDENISALEEEVDTSSVSRSLIKEERNSFETVEAESKTKNLEDDYTFNQTENVPSKKYRKKLHCNECDFTSISGNLTRHIRTVHQGLKFQCSHCTMDIFWTRCGIRNCSKFVFMMG